MPVGRNALSTVSPVVPCLFYAHCVGCLPGYRVPDLSHSTGDLLCSW